MGDADLRGLLIASSEVPDAPHEPAHVFPDPRIGPEGRGAAEEPVDRDHRNLAEAPPGGLGLDRDLEGEGPPDGPALKPKLVETLTAEHLDAGREIRERGAREAPEQEVGGCRKRAAEEAASEPAAAMRIAGATDEVAAFLHERQHVPDDEDGADLVRSEDQHIAAAGRCDAGPDGVDHTPAKTVVNHPDLRVVGAGALGSRNARILKVVVNDEDLVRRADQRRKHLEHNGEAPSFIPHGHDDAEHGVGLVSHWNTWSSAP